MDSVIRIRMLAGMGATILAVTPIQMPLGSRAVASSAECTTCCSAGGIKCVVCSASCVTVDNAYDAGGGKCPISQT
jgi:hypothetical protein